MHDTQLDPPAQGAAPHVPPAGYCPHCDYRIDPGICPECGERVDQEQLRLKPRAVRRRKWIRRSAWLAVIIALAIGGHWFYRSNVWRKWVPTSYLLAQAPCGGWTHDELVDRLNNGKLSAKEAADFFDASFPVDLIVRSPHPKAVVPTITLNTPGNKYPIKTSLNAIRQIGPWRLSVDGRVINPYSLGCRKGGFLNNGDEWDSGVLNKLRLDVGKHTIEITGPVMYDLKPSGNAPSFSGFPITRTRTLSKTLEIVDRPVGAIVKPQYIETLAIDVAGSIRLVLSKQADSEYLYIDFINGHPPITLAGILRITNAKTGQLIGTSSLTIPKASSTGGFGMMIEVDKSISFERLKCNVEFVPDAEKAFVSGDTTYFGGRMTWRNVSVIVKKRGKYGDEPYDSEIHSPKYTRPPDTVTKWTPDDGDKTDAVPDAP